MVYLDVFLMILITFIFVLLFIPVVRAIAIHVGALDLPNARKVHKVPIPRLGEYILVFYLGICFLAKNLYK